MKLLLLSIVIFYLHCQQNVEATVERCRPNNEADTLLCSGRGTCESGRCQCNKRSNPEETIYGQYCECDNFSCPRNDGLVCSGPNHGICLCGMCACATKRAGSACECDLATNNCSHERSGAICSGHGICTCNTCKCDEGFYGKYCEECSTCPEARVY